MTDTTANDLNVARASGVLAANVGDARDSCLWESGPMRDAWLAGYDAHAGEPLIKVLPAGGPILAERACPKCGLSAFAGGPPANCPCSEDQIGACGLVTP